MGISLAAIASITSLIVGYGNGIGTVRKQDVVHLFLDNGLVVTATSIGD
jgi:hypothetical protein